MAASAKVFKKLADEKAPGPSPTFTPYHLIVAVELMAEKSLGRNKLAKELGVGEGAVRTLLDRLRYADLVDCSRNGCALSVKGNRVWKEYSSVMRKVKIGKNDLTACKHSYAALIKGSGEKVRSGIEQRDAAIVMGAKSVTTIIFKNGKLVIPSVSPNLEKDFPEVAGQITKSLQPAENDVIVVAGADDKLKAEYSVLAATWTLINQD